MNKINLLNVKKGDLIIARTITIKAVSEITNNHPVGTVINVNTYAPGVETWTVDGAPVEKIKPSMSVFSVANDTGNQHQIEKVTAEEFIEILQTKTIEGLEELPVQPYHILCAFGLSDWWCPDEVMIEKLWKHKEIIIKALHDIVSKNATFFLKEIALCVDEDEDTELCINFDYEVNGESLWGTHNIDRFTWAK